MQCGSLLGNPFYRTAFESQLGMRLLDGSDGHAQFDWHRVITGGESAIRLAQDLALNPELYLELNDAFRPAIVRC